eukprot:TRINITY_DN14523_c0_g2_i1.p1 TRINITY_DN14523_c0_g2~~TRINITY_DN14523_c0_g2_i1.p1  ORF type:complete len:184 (+),score=30.52 TRINITY_DN14523_c0_g2_i1:31-552(+)
MSVAVFLRAAQKGFRLTACSRCRMPVPRRGGEDCLASSTAGLTDNRLSRRLFSQVSQAEPEKPAVSEQPESSDEDGGGLFGDAWWPVAAEHCYKRLAQRPQGLPEDPMAQGVLSWVEYELARREPEEGEAAAPASAIPPSQRDEPPKPLPEDGRWVWLLRSEGELVGPGGDRG